MIFLNKFFYCGKTHGQYQGVLIYYFFTKIFLVITVEIVRSYAKIEENRKMYFEKLKIAKENENEKLIK